MINNNNRWATVIGAFVMVLVTSALLSIMNGYALSILWGWFMVPLFGLPVLNIPYAIGMAVTIRFITNHGGNDDDGAGKIIALGIAKPVFALLTGWIVLQFI